MNPKLRGVVSSLSPRTRLSRPSVGSPEASSTTITSTAAAGGNAAMVARQRRVSQTFPYVGMMTEATGSGLAGNESRRGARPRNRRARSQ
jgi:hypothetical protein